MYKGTYIKTILKAFVIVMLLCLAAQQAAAWGQLTHYSINRDAGRNSAEELSASVAPDALYDFLYGVNSMDTFAHEELPGVLYGPLDYYLYNVSDLSQKRWAVGWAAHTTSDRSSHGTTFAGSPYIDPENYLSGAGADTLLGHLLAEFAGNILSYWLDNGTMPRDIVVYPGLVEKAFDEYDTNCSTTYSDEYDQSRYLEAFQWLQAVTYAEQVLIDYRQDKKLQLGDWVFLVSAYRKYHQPYERYYRYAVGNVTEIPSDSLPLSPCVSASSGLGVSGTLLEKERIRRSENTKIKVEAGKQLIKDGVLLSHKKYDATKGTVVINFEQTVSDMELSRAYERYLEEAYMKHTGKKVKIIDGLRFKKKYITPKDVKKDYPELYQKLIDKGIIKEK